MKQIQNYLHQYDDYHWMGFAIQRKIKFRKKDRNGMECVEDPVAKQI